MPGNVVWAYGLGILASAFHLPIQPAHAETLAYGAFLLSLPLLLISVDVRQAWSDAGRMIPKLLLAFVSALVACTVVTLLWHKHLEHPAAVGGMLAGVYTGGTANMQAVGVALEVPGATFALVNASEIIAGALFLLAFLSFLPGLVRKWLPYQPLVHVQQAADSQNIRSIPLHWRQVLVHLTLAITVAGLVVALVYLITGNIKRQGLLVIGLSIFSQVLALVPAINRYPNTYRTGEYLLLVFCFGIGMLSDFSALQGNGQWVLITTLTSMGLMLGLFLIGARLFRIPADEALMAVGAAIYGPPFMPQISNALGRNDLLFPGIACTLLGLATGTHLGVLLARILGYWI
jgi:uncharacterized membrane protein